MRSLVAASLNTHSRLSPAVPARARRRLHTSFCLPTHRQDGPVLRGSHRRNSAGGYPRGRAPCCDRLSDGLTGAGVTVWLNSTPDSSRPSLAPLVDDVLVLRKIERDTWIENRPGICKMRWSAQRRPARLPYSPGRGAARTTEGQAVQPGLPVRRADRWRAWCAAHGGARRGELRARHATYNMCLRKQHTPCRVASRSS
jgi:hypothetical protein